MSLGCSSDAGCSHPGLGWAGGSSGGTLQEKCQTQCVKYARVNSRVMSLLVSLSFSSGWKMNNSKEIKRPPHPSFCICIARRHGSDGGCFGSFDERPRPFSVPIAVCAVSVGCDSYISFMK